eukprot:Skav210681  [mRNA]  locus=scaffold346:53750:62763:+ [translate_table: standard]
MPEAWCRYLKHYGVANIDGSNLEIAFHRPKRSRSQCRKVTLSAHLDSSCYSLKPQPPCLAPTYRVRWLVYIDDRNVVVTDCSLVPSITNHWTGWCERLGLVENTTKPVIVPKTARVKDLLLTMGIEPGRISIQGRVLGVDFVGKFEGAPVREQLARSRAVALASWGHWLHSTKRSAKFGTQIKYAVRAWQKTRRSWSSWLMCAMWCASATALAARIGKRRVCWKRRRRRISATKHGVHERLRTKLSIRQQRWRTTGSRTLWEYAALGLMGVLGMEFLLSTFWQTTSQSSIGVAGPASLEDQIVSVQGHVAASDIEQSWIYEKDFDRLKAQQTDIQFPTCKAACVSEQTPQKAPKAEKGKSRQQPEASPPGSFACKSIDCAQHLWGPASLEDQIVSVQGHVAASDIEQSWFLFLCDACKSFVQAALYFCQCTASTLRTWQRVRAATVFQVFVSKRQGAVELGLCFLLGFTRRISIASKRSKQTSSFQPAKQHACQNRHRKKRRKPRKGNRASSQKLPRLEALPASPLTAPSTYDNDADPLKCPRLCGGARRKKHDDDLLAGLQALLNNQQKPKQEDDLLQALKNPVAKAQSNQSFKLWTGSKQLVDQETQKRQTNGKQQRRAPAQWRSQHHVWGKPSRAQSSSCKPAWNAPRNWKLRTNDWRSNLTDQIVLAFGPNQFAAALDDPANQDAAFVCLADNSEDFQEMLDLANGEHSTMTTLLLPHDIAVPDDGVDRSNIRVPGTLRRGLQFRNFWSQSFACGSPALKNRQQVDLSKLTQERSRRHPQRNQGWVLRLVAPGTYQNVDWPTWNHMVQKAAAHARNWAVDVLDSKSKIHLGDSFRFEIYNSKDIKGMFRVHDYTTAMKLFQASGAKYSNNGQRWFVEPVAGGFDSLPNKVLWIEAQEGERWDQYACRVRRMAQAGVIAGRFQFGLRVDADDARLQPRPCTWRIDQVPESWTVAEVQELLETMSFRDIQVVAKQWRRRCASWLVKAIYPESDDLLRPVIAIPDGDPLELSVTKEAKRRQLQTRSTKLRAEHRISFPTDPTLGHVFKRAPTPRSHEPSDEYLKKMKPWKLRLEKGRSLQQQRPRPNPSQEDIGDYEFLAEEIKQELVQRAGPKVYRRQSALEHLKNCLAKTSSRATLLQNLISLVRHYGGNARAVRGFNSDDSNMVRVSCLTRAIAHLRQLRNLEQLTTHKIQRAEAKGNRKKAAFACPICTASWNDLRNLKADIIHHKDHLCQGASDRQHRLRSKRNNSIWFRNKQAWQTQLRQAWRLTKKEEKILHAHSNQLRRQLGSNKRQPKVRQNRSATKFSKQPVALAKRQRDTLQLKNHKKAKLLADGIEPNPGPTNLVILSLNTGCVASSFDILDLAPAYSFDILALQESILTKKDILSFEVKLGLLGFRLLRAEPVIANNGHAQGGCGLILKKTLPCKAGPVYNGHDGQAVTCHIGDLATTSAIWRTWPSNVPWTSWSQADVRVQEALQRELAATRQVALQKWRRDMSAVGRAASSWLNQIVSRAAPLIQDEVGQATADIESVEKLCNFWNQIWQRPPETQEVNRLQAEFKAGRFRQPLQHDSWIPTAAPLHAHAQLQRGTCQDLDGWRGDELAVLPVAAWEVFHRLCASWAHTSHCPGPGRRLGRFTCPKLSARLALDLGGCAAALDFAKCFDYAQPALAILQFKLRRFPPSLTCLFAHVWTQQARYLQHGRTFRPHVQSVRHSLPLQHGRTFRPHVQSVRHSLPQGDPASPLALMLILKDAIVDVGLLPIHQSTFLDDRVLVASSPKDLLKGIHRWQNWSQVLGLRENVGKMVFFAPSSYQRHALQHHGVPAHQIRSQIRILGVDFRAQQCEDDGQSNQDRVIRACHIACKVERVPVAVSRGSQKSLEDSSGFHRQLGMVVPRFA